MFPLTDYHNGIHALDAGYVRHHFAAIHLIVDSDRVALVDTGTYASLPRVEAALAGLGLGADAVDYVLLTHIHLDHAGGAGVMMQAFPNARLAVHPRGARHMIDPAKLMAATEQVYGREVAREHYGVLQPVPAARVIEVGAGEELLLGGRTLSFHDCPGHARHHVFIHDHAARAIFTGDTFGISYRECDVDGRAFLFPSSTPSQFDPVAMRDSVQRMLACAPEAMYLTHYSRLAPPDYLAQVLLRRLDQFVAIASSVKSEVGVPQGLPLVAGGTAMATHMALKEAIKTRLTAYLLSEARAHGVALDDAALLDLWGMDLELDAQGLALWAAETGPGGS
jgi:glyoxylase-like metal-dependent hydrolase (beta-lactamase superfamily II)